LIDLLVKELDREYPLQELDRPPREGAGSRIPPGRT
jgi:hypothetical protein